MKHHSRQTRLWLPVIVALALLFAAPGRVLADEPGWTTLSNPAIRYTVPEKPYLLLRRGVTKARDFFTGSACEVSNQEQGISSSL